MAWFDFFGNISPLSAALFLLGFGLVIFEMFHPGFGIPGIGGVLSLIIGVILTARTLEQAIVMGIAVVVFVSIAFAVVYRSFTKGRLYKKLVLKNANKSESGFRSHEDFSALLHTKGIALTPLRPAGSAQFLDSRIDVVTRGEFIKEGAFIEVIQVSGRRVVVSEADQH